MKQCHMDYYEAVGIGRQWHLTPNNKHYLLIVDYHSKFLVMKQVEGFNADNLIETWKIIFSKYGPPSKIVSDLGTNLF